MSTKVSATLSDRMTQASAAAADRFGMAPVGESRLDDALANAIDPQKMINNCAEVWRVSAEQARSVLAEHGFGGVLARLRPDASAAGQEGEIQGEPFAPSEVLSPGDRGVRIRALNPSFGEPAMAAASILESVRSSLSAFLPTAKRDTLGLLYRDDPGAFVERFLSRDAPKIDAYVGTHFGNAGPQYLVNSGIGANEQFNYFVSALANARPDCRCTWLLANSPKAVSELPRDARVDNTLFMEFSRSGITEETIKLHEFTPRAARRVVFANAGPLRELAERDGNLVLELPSEVSGRYGRNKTPILMAPMHVAGLDVRAYWGTISAACGAMDLSDPASAPVALATYLRVQQLRYGVNHIYLGTNDPLLRYSADELCQFWNEGVNRDGNDMTMSRYLGLPRDSHMNLEAILGTSEHKIAIFLLSMSEPAGHPLLCGSIDSLRSAHAGLTAGQTDTVLALANAKRCSEKMPTIVITVDRVDLASSAVLGQIWADTTLVYSRLIGGDPGSNPEVKAVRTRAAEWLADKDQAFALLGDGV
ncbi:MAG: hypothetical protein ACE5F9_12185 [Phycisphaerae bacterium]